MPKIRRNRTKPPPEGFELIEDTLKQFDQKMREAESKPNIGLSKHEALWPVFRLHHQRSRYVYEMYYKRQAISKDVYDYCLKEGYGDANLIAKWKKQGYENLCCLKCIQPRDTNHGNVCICRVPREKLDEERSIACLHCGCRGCGG